MATSTIWYIDGYPLRSGLVRDVDTPAGWRNVTAPSGQNLSVPNRSGEVYVPKTIAAGALTLSMWLFGATETQLDAEWDRLVHKVAKLHRQVLILQVRPDGSQRQCFAELSGGLRPTTVGRRGIRAALNFRIPGGVWEAVAALPFSSPIGNSLPKVVPLTALAHATAPMENVVLEIVGPITNPKVTWSDERGDSEWVSYTGSVPEGAVLRLDSARWGISGTGFAPNQAAVMLSGRRFMSIPASDSPVLTMTGSGAGLSTALKASVKPAFFA